MAKINTILKIFAFLLLFNLIFSQKAFAYLDPGTGSYILQVLIAFFLGGLFAVRLFWNKIKEFLTKIFSRNKDSKKS